MTVAKSCVKMCVIIYFWIWQFRTLAARTAGVWIIQRNINHHNTEHTQHRCFWRSINGTFLIQLTCKCFMNAILWSLRSALGCWGGDKEKQKKRKVRTWKGGGESRRKQTVFYLWPKRDRESWFRRRILWSIVGDDRTKSWPGCWKLLALIYQHAVKDSGSRGHAALNKG